MDFGKFSMILIGFMVGALVLSSFIPVIGSITATDEIIENDGYFTMQKVTADDTTEYILTWDRTSNAFKLNGENVDIDTPLSVSVAMTDKSLSRYTPTGTIRIQSWVQGVGGSMGYGAETIKISFKEGVETITADEGLESEQVRTVNYEFAYFLSNSGDYVMKKADKSVNLFPDTEIYAVGVTDINSSSTPIVTLLKMTGNASEVEFSSIFGSNPTFSNIVIDSTTNPKYVDVVELNKVTATATYDDTDTAITYSYFVVPSEITAELTNHPTGVMISLFNLLPLIAGVGLLLGAVAYFLSRTYL